MTSKFPQFTFPRFYLSAHLSTHPVGRMNSWVRCAPTVLVRDRTLASGFIVRRANDCTTGMGWEIFDCFNFTIERVDSVCITAWPKKLIHDLRKLHVHTIGLRKASVSFYNTRESFLKSMETSMRSSL